MTDGIAEVEGSPGFSGDGPAALPRRSATGQHHHHRHAAAQHCPPAADLIQRPRFGSSGCSACRLHGYGDCDCDCDCECGGTLCWLRDEGYFEPGEEWEEVANDYYHLSNWRRVNLHDQYRGHIAGPPPCECGGNHYVPRYYNHGAPSMSEELLYQSAMAGPGPFNTRFSRPQDQFHHHHYHEHHHQHQHQAEQRRGGLLRFMADTVDHVRQRSRSRSRSRSNAERESGTAASAVMSGALMNHEPGCDANGNVAICGTVCACDDMREGRRDEVRTGGLRRDTDGRRRRSGARRVRFSE